MSAVSDSNLRFARNPSNSLGLVVKNDFAGICDVPRKYHRYIPQFLFYTRGFSFRSVTDREAKAKYLELRRSRRSKQERHYYLDTNNTMVSTRTAFLLVSFSLGQLGDGLNIFQGIYLVGVGWAQGAVGTALSLMGLTSLVMQPFAGNWVDTTSIDRRWFLVLASVVTACSASTILFVHPSSLNHALIYTSKFVEGVASSFIAPCLAALTLACFGPTQFDEVMASNVYWGHVGSVAAAVLAGIVAVIGYPHVEYCFLVIGASALVAIVFVRYLPQGNPLWGRGLDASGTPSLEYSDTDTEIGSSRSEDSEENEIPTESTPLAPRNSSSENTPQVASYWEVLSESRTLILCMTGFFFQYVNICAVD